MLSAPALAGPTAAEVARQVQDASLDPAESYRVVDFSFSKEDIRIYLNAGYLVFTKPVNGVRTGAVFVADTEGGDAEILLLPPVRSERLSLANFTDSPNLDEHFRSALLLFTDDTARVLLDQLQAAESKRVPEMGALLLDQWNPSVRNLSSSFQVLLVGDALNSRRSGFFYMTVAGTKLGNFDVFYDPRAEEDIMVGQVADHKGANYFDVWTSFGSRLRRQGTPPARPDYRLDNYRITATLRPDLVLDATSKADLILQGTPGRALSFAISRQVRVLEAKVDGKAAEVFQKDSLRSNLIHDNGNEYFLVVTPDELEPGKTHEIEIKHQGAVVSKAGDRVYYVSARGFWYPRAGLDFARYELTFSCPKDLGFVATGEVVEENVTGDWRTTKRVTTSPIRFAGFNLGAYESIAISHESTKVTVYANKNLESALIPKASASPPLHEEPYSRRRIPVEVPAPVIAPPPDPLGRMRTLANDVAGAFDYMASLFGPPPLKTLTVSPIPANFGQGFPGLLYVSTLAYLDPSQRPRSTQSRYQQTFFSEMLDAHEVAHQWFGNMVITSGYQDGWLMEALANYSALLFLEKRKGPHALETVLDDYRTHLLSKGESGKTLESAGPITWGYRLQSSLSPSAWQSITYEKGTWVMHMLRRKLGDDRFLAMLRTMCQRYRYQAITTAQFRQLAQEFLPPRASDPDLSNFFENWVYGTGIPAVRLAYTVRGLKVTGTVTQSEVSDDFTARIPIEVQAGRSRALHWVASSNDPVPFSISLPAPASRVALALNDALITAKK